MSTATRRRNDASRAAQTLESLRRIRNMVKSEVEKLQSNIEVLSEGDALLKENATVQSRYDKSLRFGTRVLRGLKRRQVTDSVLMVAAFVFFLICVAYIFKKRLRL